MTLRPFAPAAALLVLITVPSHAVWPTDPDLDVVVTGASLSQREQVAVADGTGGIFVTWEDRRSGSNRIYAQRISADGEALWGAHGVPVGDGGGDQHTPHLARDGVGGVVVAWEDNRGYRDIYAQRFDADGVPQWGDTGLAVCTESWTQSAPRVLADPATGVFMAWNDGRYAANEDIFGNRLDLDGTKLWGSGDRVFFSTWVAERGVRLTPDGSGGIIAVTSALTAQELRARRLTSDGTDVWGGALTFTTETMNYPSFSIAGDGLGGVFVAWSSTWYDLQGQYLDATGARQWNGGEDQALCPVSDSTSRPGVVADGTGGVYVVFSDSRTAITDGWANRFDADGTPLWGDGGVLVGQCTNSATVTPVVDGDRHLLVSRLDRDGQIRVSKLDATGTELWSTGGVVVSSAPGGSYDPQSLVLLEDDAVITVFDRAPGTYADIFAKKVLSDGTLGQILGVADAAPGATPVTAWPNPFRSSVALGFTGAREVVAILDVQGRMVRELRAGSGPITWDGRDARGHAVPPGVYHVRTEGETGATAARLVRLP